MKITVNDTYHASVLTLRGKFLGSLHGEAFRGALDDLVRQGKANVVVDLSATDFIDSSGIGTLISALTTMRRAGGDVRLAGMEKRIRDVFLITKLLGSVFDEYPTIEAATASFEARPPRRAEA